MAMHDRIELYYAKAREARIETLRKKTEEASFSANQKNNHESFIVFSLRVL